MKQSPLQKVLMGMFAKQTELCAKHGILPTEVGLAYVSVVAKGLATVGVPADLIQSVINDAYTEAKRKAEPVIKLPN